MALLLGANPSWVVLVSGFVSGIRGRFSRTCLWSRALVQLKGISEECRLMVDGMFSTMCMGTSSKFLGSTCRQFGLWVVVLMVSCGKNCYGFKLFFLSFKYLLLGFSWFWFLVICFFELFWWLGWEFKWVLMSSHDLVQSLWEFSWFWLFLWIFYWWRVFLCLSFKNWSGLLWILKIVLNFCRNFDFSCGPYPGFLILWDVDVLV